VPVSYYQVPFESLVELGTDLESLSTSLGEDHRGAEDVAGLGRVGSQGDVQDAVSEFRDEWKTSLLELENNISSWGGLTKGIGQLVAEWDAQTAAALRPR
jgi:hypothetical protein